MASVSHILISLWSFWGTFCVHALRLGENLAPIMSSHIAPVSYMLRTFWANKKTCSIIAAFAPSSLPHDSLFSCYWADKRRLIGRDHALNLENFAMPSTSYAASGRTGAWNDILIEQSGASFSDDRIFFCCTISTLPPIFHPLYK